MSSRVKLRDSRSSLTLALLDELEKILREQPGSVQAWSAVDLLRQCRAEEAWEDLPEIWERVETLWEEFGVN